MKKMTRRGVAVVGLDPDKDKTGIAVIKDGEISLSNGCFVDVMRTIKELQDISQRLHVAMMLSRGSNYQEVSAETGASTATICRVNKCLLYGGGGYRSVIDKMNGKEE